MAVTVTQIDQWNDSGRINTILAVVFSGSYAAGGDLLDFAPYQQGSIQPEWVDIRGKAGFVYEYDITNKKIMVRGVDPAAAGGTITALPEIATAAYPAGVTGDIVRIFLISKLN